MIKLLRFLEGKILVRYLVAGGTAAFTDLLLLHIFTDYFGIWYVLSAALAFSVAFFVSFFLQKYWTFKDKENKGQKRQMLYYFFIAVFNLLLNTISIYFVVEFFEIHYLLAQIIVGMLIAMESFVLYGIFVFKKKEKSKKLKIIIASNSLYVGEGSVGGNYTKNIKDRLNARGIEVGVVLYKKKRFSSVLNQCSYLYRLILSGLNGDAVIALDTFSVGLPSVIFGKIFQKKVILRIGGDFLWEKYVEETGNLITLKQFYKRIERIPFAYKIVFYISGFVMKNASALVFNTSWQKTIFVREYGLKDEKCFVVENFYGEKNSALLPIKKNFLFVGRPIKLKNIDMLKECVEEARIVDNDISLEIAMGVGREEVFDLIRRCYALVLPSLSDVAPNVVLEALSFGKPVIVSKEIGIIDRVGESVVLVDPLDKKSITEGILFLSDKKNYDYYCAKAEVFSFRHSWEDISQEFISIINNQ